MEADARYAWVGAAVLLLVAALVGGLLWLHQLRGGDGSAFYVIHFERQALDGLEVGAPVNVRGIKVGRVDDYSLADGEVGRVRVLVRLDRRTPVRTNTEAVITRNVVTGIAAITLLTPVPPGPPLTRSTAGERYPIIAEGRSDLDELAGRVQKIGDQAADALVGINRLLAADNRRSVMAAVNEVRALAAGMSERLAKLDRMLERGGRAADAVGGAAVEIGAAAGRLASSGERTAAAASAFEGRFAAAGEAAASAIERAGERLDGTLARTDAVLIDAQTALAQLTRSVQAIERQGVKTGQRLEATATSVDDQLAAAVSELRLAAESASRLLARLEDPRSALFGPPKRTLGPGEVAP